MTDKFTGHWLVSEYVFNPNGSFAGIVRQRRHLEPQPDGKTRVIQYCNPGSELASHPMGNFTGKRVFDLSVEGRKRLYHGPDVIGMGLPWGDTAMTGRGVWSLFGHNFTSFAVLPTPERQITGGKFYNASEMIANIVGIAVPEVEGQNGVYPAYEGRYDPRESSMMWTGTKTTFDTVGQPLSETLIRRHYHDAGWTDSDDYGEFIVELREDGARHRVSGTAQGIGKRVGWLFEMTLVQSPPLLVDKMDVVDHAGGNLVGFTRVEVDGALSRVEVMTLKPG